MNKGDHNKYNVRSRIVARELKARTKEALLAHELFSAMPPWEMVKALFSLLVTDGVSRDGSELEMAVFDISRAHLMPKADRLLYIEIPKEDLLPSDGDVVGRLNRNMYGCRDASNGWMRDWQVTTSEANYVIGKASPALFYNPDTDCRG